MEPKNLKERTLRFAVGMAALCRTTQADWAGRRLADQMFRSATSVAANYHAACRARSRREFVAKMGLVVEEAEETVFWLEFASRASLIDASGSATLTQEARELLAIFTASTKTAASNQPRRSSN